MNDDEFVALGREVLARLEAEEVEGPGGDELEAEVRRLRAERADLNDEIRSTRRLSTDWLTGAGRRRILERTRSLFDRRAVIDEQLAVIRRSRRSAARRRRRDNDARQRGAQLVGELARREPRIAELDQGVAEHLTAIEQRRQYLLGQLAAIEAAAIDVGAVPARLRSITDGMRAIELRQRPPAAADDFGAVHDPAAGRTLEELRMESATAIDGLIVRVVETLWKAGDEVHGLPVRAEPLDGVVGGLTSALPGTVEATAARIESWQIAIAPEATRVAASLTDRETAVREELRTVERERIELIVDRVASGL